VAVPDAASGRRRLTMALPRISVVTPSFNQGRYLETAIRSVLDQDYPNVEYLIMDGGSTDGSVDIIRRYADRLAYWVSAPDGGQSAAIASGFQRSTGDVLGWLNSDDVYLPGALSRVAQTFAQSPSVDFVYGTRRIIDEAGRMIRAHRPPTLLHKYYFIFGQWIPQECAFWRRTLYDRVGGLDPTLSFSLDFSLFIRMWAKGRFKRIDAELGALRSHAETKTNLSSDVMVREGAAIRTANGIPNVNSRLAYVAGERLILAQAALEKPLRSAIKAVRRLTGAKG
jgi:glycosyltransferase involved in cell wall biosynthesis